MYYLQSCGGAQVRPEVVKADGMVNIMMVERTLDRCGVTHRNRYWTLSSPVTVYNPTWKCIQQPTLYIIQCPQGYFQ